MPSIVPISLAPGNVVRIIGGRGTRVVAKRGLLWVSEEGDLDDHVLAAGEGITLTNDGKTMVFAVHAARITVELADGLPMPRVLEVATADGLPGRRIRRHRPMGAAANGLRALVLWVCKALGVAPALGRMPGWARLPH